VTLSKVVPRALLAFVGICLAQMIAGMLVPMKPVAVPHFFLWLLLTNAIVVAALSAVAARAEWRGWRLGAVIAAFPLAVSFINLIEGVVFLANSHIEWGRIFLLTLVSAALSVPVWALLFGRSKDGVTVHYHPLRENSPSQRAWKFALSDCTYLVLYYAAGMLIFPYVKDFYATQRLPSMGNIVLLQLFIRGPLFVLLALALARMLGLPRTRGALAVGLIFTLLTGVAPLLMPNPYFPDSVRWVHLCEVTSSNFVFGTVVAWLWGPPRIEQARALSQAA
jgi:hypothetical protein